MTYLRPAGWDGLVAKARRHQRRQHPRPVTGFGLDSHEQNAAIGLVTSATASIMAGSHFQVVRWEVCGTMPGLPGLTPHAFIPIDSNTGHVRA